jgi:ADP-ribose pyrophosphatase YjhB (NUDIX family)
MPTDYPVWTEDGWREVAIPDMDGVGLVVPNVAAVVFRGDAREEILLQRRDKEGEPVRGRWEIPGGRWHAGESAGDAVRREIREETGLDVIWTSADGERREASPGRPFDVVRPEVVVAGLGGAYPALVVVFLAEADGNPRALPGETREPRWWPVAGVLAMRDADPSALTGPTLGALHAVLRS